jgi:hypothetical protein
LRAGNADYLSEGGMWSGNAAIVLPVPVVKFTFVRSAEMKL